jgi:hypothetical protein
VAAVVGVALVAGGRGGTASHLPKLPATASQPQVAAAADPTANRASSAGSAMYPYRSVHYQLAGPLPDLGGKAAAYQLGTTLDQAAAARLIAAFGMHGQPADAGGAWQLVDGAKILTISKAPGLPWYLGSAASGGGCVSSSDGSTVCSGVAASGTASSSVAGSAASGGSSGSGTTNVAPGCPPPVCPPGQLCPQYCVKTSPPVPPQHPAGLPSQADAEKQARALWSQAGVNLAGATVTVRDQTFSWSVEVAPRLGSLPTQNWSWEVSIGPRGSIDSARGYLDKPRLLGDYPLSGTAAGLVRLQQGPIIGPGPLPAEGAPTCPPGAMCATGLPTPTVTITGVHLALAWEGQYLAPIYVFEAPNGEVAGMAPAVADGYLQPPTTPSPKTPGSPVPVPQTVPAVAPLTTVGSPPCGAPVPPGMTAPAHCLG